jgi:xanthine permease
MLVVALCGQLSRLRWLFPPVVTGSVLTIIGTSLIPVAMNWAAGGSKASDYGNPRHLLLALFVLIVIVLVQRFARGFLPTISILIGLVFGAGAALCLGQMNLTGVRAEPWVALTTPFWFGPPRFDAMAILTMSVVALVCMIESVGIFFGVGKLVGREPDEKDLVRGLRAEGVAMVLGGCFNSFPYTTYGQNAGLVAMTGVRSRYVVAAAGATLMMLGLLPRFAALIASIPAAVLGGAGIVSFGMVAAAGIRMLSEVDYRHRGNLFVVAISIGLGLGVSIVPQIFSALPVSVRWLFSDGIIVGSLTAVGLSLLLCRLDSSASAFPPKHESDSHV